MLSARDRAQSDAAKAGALTKLLDAASPLEVLNHLGQALPKDARLKEFELQADTGRATIELPPMRHAASSSPTSKPVAGSRVWPRPRKPPAVLASRWSGS